MFGSSRGGVLQRRHTLEGWRSAMSILHAFLQRVDNNSITKFTLAAAPQLTALLATGEPYVCCCWLDVRVCKLSCVDSALAGWRATGLD